MRADIYANLQQLSYGELLKALENIKSKMNNSDVEPDTAQASYYNALVEEMDKRQKCVL